LEHKKEETDQRHEVNSESKIVQKENAIRNSKEKVEINDPNNASNGNSNGIGNSGSNS